MIERSNLNYPMLNDFNCDTTLPIWLNTDTGQSNYEANWNSLPPTEFYK